MRVARDREPEQVGEQDLAGRRVDEIVAPDDLAHTLSGIVDHDRELVRGYAVGAAHDEVIDDRAAQPV